MKRPFGSALGAARVAVVGAEAREGCFLREILALRKLPGSRVNLYATCGSEAVISEYDGEARLIQESVPDEIADHDVVFLCERGELATKVAAACGPTTVVIDLVNGLPGDLRPRLVHTSIDSGNLDTPHGFYTVPHPLASITAELLHDLDRELAVREVVGLILRPAADHGEEGLEELRQQTANLLNFTEMPTEVFGGQLAFNVIGTPATSETRPLAERVAVESGSLLGWNDRRLTLSLVTVPVFHGHSLRFRVRFEESVTPQRVREVASNARFIEAHEENPASTPVDVSANRRLVLHDVNSDGLGGVWLSAVAGGSGSRGAEDAIKLAERVVGL